MSRAASSLLLVCSLAIAPRGTACSQTVAPAAAEILAVRVGSGGCYKAGLWTPVEVVFRGNLPLGAELTLVVPDGDGIPSRTCAPLVFPGEQGLPAKAAEPFAAAVSPRDGGSHSAVLCVRFGRVRSDLCVELHQGEAVLARRIFRAGVDFPAATASEKRILLAVGSEPTGLEEATGVLGQVSRARSTVIQLRDVRELPPQWHGYEAVNTVFLATSGPQVYADLEADSMRLSALDEWVRMGGRLVLTVGREAETVLAADAPLARFAPGKLDRMILLRQTGALEAYAGSTRPISATSRGQTEIRVPQLVNVDGVVEARDGSLPLVVRRAYGFGEIVFAAFDTDLAPLAQWPDRGRLVAALLGGVAGAGDEADETTAIMHYGYTDMAGQLRSALDRFEGVRSVPFALVAGLVILYILWIGPVDYFFLRKLVGRMELTWVTFPLAVLVVSVAACLLAGQFKGDRLRVNQVSLVDVDAASGRVRGTSWANVFSPEMARYDLAFRPSLSGSREAAEADALCAWLGLPGPALGGMDPKTAEPAVWRRQYRFAVGLDAMLGVPIPVWSTKSLTARWSADDAPRPKADLNEQDQLPVGRITNTLDFPLRECLLMYGRWAYPLGTIEPGRSVEVGPTLPRRELKTLLTGQKMVYDEKAKRFAQQNTPYELGSTDPVYVLRAMAFFEAAGGRRYTGLANRHQEFVDLSHLLRTDRAVLMALGPEDAAAGGARLLSSGQAVDDRNPHPTVFRFVFPVVGTSGERRGPAVEVRPRSSALGSPRSRSATPSTPDPSPQSLTPNP